MSVSINLPGVELLGVEKISTTFKLDKEVLDSLKAAEDRMEALVKANVIKKQSINRVWVVEEGIKAFVKNVNDRMDKAEAKGSEG